MPRRGLRGGPDVDAAVGVGPGVRKPGLGDQAGKVREGGGHDLGDLAVVLPAHALERKLTIWRCTASTPFVTVPLLLRCRCSVFSYRPPPLGLPPILRLDFDRRSGPGHRAKERSSYRTFVRIGSRT